MSGPSGLHHLAINVQDIKGPLHFFTQACGMELKAFYWMHGNPGAFHLFLKLNDNSYLALAKDPNDSGMAYAPEHVRNIWLTSRMRGAMHHVAFNVDSVDDLLNLRDRIRSYGFQVLGPINHGMFQSIYVPGTAEGIFVEFATGGNINPKEWIDGTTIAHSQLTSEELERYVNPPAFEGGGGAVPQPQLDPAHQTLSPEMASLMSNPGNLAAFELQCTELCVKSRYYDATASSARHA
jgi:catechol 2,3-dioxygenase-like lactoylglutathione lyase family enzyme